MYSLPYPPHRPPIHTLKFLTMDQLISTFWVKDIIPLKFQKQEFVFWKTHAIAYLLTWHATETFVLIHFLQRLPLYLLKMTKQNHFFFHTFSVFMFCHSEIFFSFPLSVFFSPSCRQHPAPPVTVLTELQERTLLQSSLWRISYKSL